MTSTAVPSRRERLRPQALEEIREHGYAQSAAGGPTALSLNGIAKAMGMSGPAMYRYVGSRDELLATLVTESYEELAGALIEAAERAHRRTPEGRVRAARRGLPRLGAGASPSLSARVRLDLRVGRARSRARHPRGPSEHERAPGGDRRARAGRGRAEPRGQRPRARADRLGRARTASRRRSPACSCSASRPGRGCTASSASRSRACSSSSASIRRACTSRGRPPDRPTRRLILLVRITVGK